MASETAKPYREAKGESSKKKDKAKLESVEVKKASNGGFIVSKRMNYMGGDWNPPEESVFEDEGEAMDYVAKCLKG